MEYISKVLGISVLRSSLEKEDRVNFKYSLELAELDGLKCIFAKPKDALGTINQIKEDVKSIKRIHNLPVVFTLDFLSKQRAGSFIEHKIPFVVNEKQIYLPHLAVYMTEKFSKEFPDTPKTIFPSAQLILFSFLYNKNRPLYLNGLSKKLKLSDMSISRGATQLISLKLLNEKREGTLRILTSDLSPKELFDKAFPYLINPIRTKLYVEKKYLPKNIFKSGKSFLGISDFADCYATFEKLNTIPSLPALIDTDTQCILEIWRYDPFILSKNDAPDELSLYMAYKNEYKNAERLLHKIFPLKKPSAAKKQPPVMTDTKAPSKSNDILVHLL